MFHSFFNLCSAVLWAAGRSREFGAQSFAVGRCGMPRLVGVMMATRIAITAFAFGLGLLPVDSTRAQAVCGDGIRSGAEQCDDGNRSNLDGCDASCRFEQTHRINELKLQFGTSSACTINALGGAIVGGTAQNNIQVALDTSVGNGTTSILLHMLGLDDLSGTSDASVQIGVLNALPILPGATTYDGHNDLDGWYLPAPDEISTQRIPLSQLNGSIIGGVLSAGPGSALLRLDIGGVQAAWSMSSLRLLVTGGSSSTPLLSTGVSPGHLASEHLDPSLQSFATAGQPVGTAGGSLCANISAESLQQTPLPVAFVGCGISNCTQCYTAANTLLDAVVGGCNTFIGQQLKPTQPDSSDPAAPLAGSGPPYTLSANAQHVVTTCRAQGVVTDLATCLHSAAYSSFFTFSSDRVIATTTTPSLIFRDGFEG